MDEMEERPVYESTAQPAQGQPAAQYGMRWDDESRPPRRRRGRGALALLMVLCVLCSGLAGFAGSWYAQRLWQQRQDEQGATNETATRVEERTVTYLRGEEGMSTMELAAKVSPTVVQITTELTVEDFWMQRTATGAGSGVILSEDGTIITNNHVIEDADSIRVTLASGEEYEATLVATDEQSDIAVIHIDSEGLPYATIGNSDDLVIGQDVLAVGNPLGELGGTATNGIISAVDRSVTVEGHTMTLIQTNAAISPGNSGGGLFDAKGELIGIVNAKYGGDNVEGLGFAIPINTAMHSAQDLIDRGYVTGRINVGLTLLNIDSQQLAFQYRVGRLGVYVYSTQEGSSAELAGFKTADCILSVDGTEVSTAEDVKAVFNQHEVGDSVTVRVLRDGDELDLTLMLTEYAPDDAAA